MNVNALMRLSRRRPKGLRKFRGDTIEQGSPTLDLDDLVDLANDFRCRIGCRHSGKAPLCMFLVGFRQDTMTAAGPGTAGSCTIDAWGSGLA